MNFGWKTIQFKVIFPFETFASFKLPKLYNLFQKLNPNFHFVNIL